MSDIDYVKNIQVLAAINDVGTGTNNEFVVNINSFPITNPPDMCIIKQISWTDADVSMSMFTLWSDIANTNIASWVSTTGSSSITPGTQLKLLAPLAGQYRFKVYELLAGSFQPTADVAFIVLNLEFIKYKK